MPEFSWLCPECGRRVPNKMEICRCGGSRVEVLPAGSLDAPSTTAPAPRSNMLPWLVLGIVTVAAAGGLIALQVIPVKGGPAAVVSDPAAPSAPIASADTPNEPIAPITPAQEVVPSAAPLAPLAPNAPLTSNSEALEDIVSRSIPAIVSIEAGQGRGSGFFAAPRTVITNRHVVQTIPIVTVRLSNGQPLQGRVETTSQEYDLAIVRVDTAPPSQPVLPLGTVNEVRPGQEVIAIGLALGVFQNSVTRGIISAVRRADRTVMLQTDAAINPGNSGGPLLNRSGQVIGINTMKITGAAESLGFAVAIDHARTLLSGGAPPPGPLASSAQPSRPLAPSFSARSETDAAREDGTQQYTKIVEAAARRAAQIDTFWERIKANCAVRVTPGYDREWFAVWDGRATLTGPDGSCASAIREIEDLAGEVRSVVTSAQESARRASVLPGQMREIRRRYRMDWPGFDR
jgi:S1-C subfamily serine protease